MSSEAKKALGCRGPADVVNMAVLWGLGQERGTEAIAREARNVVVQADMKRRSFRGVIDVICGGEKPKKVIEEGKSKNAVKGSGKRKATVISDKTADDTTLSKPISKREQKRQAKRAKIEASFDKSDGTQPNTLSKEPEKPT